MYILVLPIHEDECVITGASCVNRLPCIGYEMRTYRDVKPFNVDVFKIDNEAGSTAHSRSLSGVRK